MGTTLKKLLTGEHAKACLVIFAVLLAAYILPPLMHRSQNPIYQRSGLTAMISPGRISGQNTIDPNDGFTSQALGHRAAESWLSGDVPYWNYYEGLGAPLAGETQSAAFFPLTLLQRFGTGFVVMHLLLQFTAGVATYLFFRKLKVRYGIAVLGGVLFALSGAFAWLTNAPFNVVAFLPLMLLGFEAIREQVEKGKRGGWWLLAAALALSLYAGFPEGAFIDAIFAYGWGAIRLLHIKPKLRKPYIYRAVQASIVGVLLAGPMLVALAGYLPYGLTGGHGGGGYAHNHLPTSTLPALFMPYIFGPIFGFVLGTKPHDLFIFWSNVGGYLTMPLLLFALVGLFAKRPRALILYPAIFALVVALKIYGFGPAALLVNAIPGMNQVAFYRYSPPVLIFAVIILAVFGIEALMRKEIPKLKVIVLTALTFLMTLLLAVFSRKLLHQLAGFPSHRGWAILSIIWAMSILLAPLFIYMRPRLRFIGIAALLTVDAFVMFTIPMLSLPKTTPVDTAPVSYLQQHLGLNRFYTLHPIQPNYGSYYKIASLNVNDLPIPKRFADYTPKLDSNADPLVFTGYSRQDPFGPAALDEFGKNMDEFENAGVKYLVADHGQVTTDSVAKYDLKLAFSDGRIDIFALPAPKPYFEASPDCVLNYAARDQATAHCKTGTTLIRRELYMPGWSATVNGKRQAVTVYHDVFQELKLPAGNSTVKFTYNPPFIAAGYVMLAAGAVLAAGLYLREKRLK